MLDATWVLENLQLVAEYHRHVLDGSAPSGKLLHLIQLLQWAPAPHLEFIGDSADGSGVQQSGWPCVFRPAAWWHSRGPSQKADLPHKFYVAYASIRRGTPLQVCSECGHETHQAATLAVFALRWERCTGRALPSLLSLQSGSVVHGNDLPRAPPWPSASPYEVARPLLGYALDNASVIAGGHASFCVSSELPGEITAVFERLLCWDSDSRGPGFQTLPTKISPRKILAEYQNIRAGSYGLVDITTSQSRGKIGALTDCCTLVAVVWPTGARKTSRQEGIMTHFAGDAPQAILAAEFDGGTVSVGLTPSGHLAVSLNGSELLRSERALQSRQWCTVAASCKGAPDGTQVSLLVASAPSLWSADLQPGHELCTAQSKRTCRLGTLCGVSLGALRRQGIVEAHYNGKIAGPTVYGSAFDLVSPAH